MAVVTTYITSSELKAARDLSGYTYADADITRAIAAASRAIDSACQRRFYIDDVASNVRYYTPDRSDVVLIDDIVTITSILSDTAGSGTYDYTWSATTDYFAAPANAVLDGQPFTQLVRRQNASRWFPGWNQALKITGKFGWPTVPDPIAQATLILAARYLARSREATFGVLSVGGLGSENVGMRISRTDPDVYELISPYMKRIPIL